MRSELSQMVVLQMQKVFLEAMKRGFASHPRRVDSVPELPGSEVVTHLNGDFVLKDVRISRENSQGSKVIFNGTITIWYKGEPVWYMSYQGSYYKKAIGFLEMVLLEAYRESIFSGGRGCEKRLGEEFNYINKLKSNDFKAFSGREEVRSKSFFRPFLFGSCTYKGGLLI